jgi:hypothetical protein
VLEIEAFAPLGDDFPAGVQPHGDLVVVQAVCGHEHDLGPDHVSIWQRIATGLCFQDFPLLLTEFDDVWAFPGHSFPLSGGTVPPIEPQLTLLYLCSRILRGGRGDHHPAGLRVLMLKGPGLRAAGDIFD